MCVTEPRATDNEATRCPSSRPALVAIVGRPNVGKSTLFNRLTRSRRAIVGDEPGITRDRLYGQAEWRGRRFEVVDTGGMLPDDASFIPSAILRQAREAVSRADAIFWVVDARTELAAPDRQLSALLRKTGKPVALLANKVESDRQEQAVGPLHELGVAPLLPISAEHGRGIDAALDWLLAHLPAAAPAADTPRSPPPGAADQRTGEEGASEAESGAAARPAAIAIIGRPNVGKSTLLNRLVGEERAIVSEIPGTTRDAVDALITRHGRQYRLVDTAGIRRKGKTELMAEKLSVVMARQHLRRSDLALLVLDASAGVVALDATIAGYATEGGRSCILVANKWDLARAAPRRAQRRDFEAEARRKLKFLSYAPMVFISAARGEGLSRLFTALDGALAARRKRVTTAELNRFLATLDWDRASTPKGHKLKVYYMVQASVAPPTFVLFVDKPRELHFALRRYLENQLRRAFGFEGAPIEIKLRVSGGRSRS